MEEGLCQTMLCQVAPTPATSMVDKSLLAAVKTEMTLFESRGSQGALFAVNLKLLNVDTTSFCGERTHVLRHRGLCMKIRSRLSDRMINILCFLRSYYLAQRRAN